MMDTIVGWALIILCLSTITGVILAIACGYGDDQEETVYLCHCGEVATVMVSTPGLRAIGQTHYCTNHATELLARAYYPRGYGDEPGEYRDQ